MFPEYHYMPTTDHRDLPADRRPLAGSNEIRMRVRRALSKQEA